MCYLFHTYGRFGDIHAKRTYRQGCGISGVMTEVSSWRSLTSSPGAQIDLIIDRADRVINLCEIKYSKEPYTINKSEFMSLKTKMAAFLSETKTRKAAHTTMITTCGLAPNAYSSEIMFNVTLDDLFEPV